MYVTTASIDMQKASRAGPGSQRKKRGTQHRPASFVFSRTQWASKMRPAFPIAAPMLAPHCPPTKPTAEPRPRQPQTKRPTREVGRASLSLLEAISARNAKSAGNTCGFHRSRGGAGVYGRTRQCARKATRQQRADFNPSGEGGAELGRRQQWLGPAERTFCARRRDPF